MVCNTKVWLEIKVDALASGVVVVSLVCPQRTFEDPKSPTPFKPPAFSLARTTFLTWAGVQWN